MVLLIAKQFGFHLLYRELSGCLLLERRSSRPEVRRLLVIQAQSQPDNIATIPLHTATFVRPVQPVA